MGTIKVFGNKKHVAATHVRPIKDHNEVFNHFLRAVYVTLSLRNPGGVSLGHVSPYLFTFIRAAGVSLRIFDHPLMCREEVEVLLQVRNMATTRPAQRLRNPILLPMPICLLYNDKSWRLSRRIQATMECTYKQFHEQRAVMPVSCELLDLL